MQIFMQWDLNKKPKKKTHREKNHWTFIHPYNVECALGCMETHCDFVIFMATNDYEDR